jgi:hypothetical protein
MADVFISYARKDRDAARALASAFESRGWSVWWDRDIIAGETFDQAIERELGAARAVVVLWSSQSVGSEWVKNEVAFAVERGALVPAVIDDAKPPLEFRRRQTADLTGWRGEGGHEGFDALLEGVAAKLGAPTAPPSVVAAAPRTPVPTSRGARRIVAVVLLLLAIGVVLWRPHAVVPPSSSTNDLADAVTGTYAGSVQSDSRGHSQSDVTVTVTKLGARRVRVSADYDRMQTVDVDLTRAGESVLSAGGDVTFMVEPSGRLGLNYDGVAYDGHKRP